MKDSGEEENKTVLVEKKATKYIICYTFILPLRVVLVVHVAVFIVW